MCFDRLQVFANSCAQKVHDAALEGRPDRCNSSLHQVGQLVADRRLRLIRELCNRVLEDIPPLVGLVAHLGEGVVDGRHRTLYRRVCIDNRAPSCPRGEKDHDQHRGNVPSKPQPTHD